MPFITVLLYFAAIPADCRFGLVGYYEASHLTPHLSSI